MNDAEKFLAAVLPAYVAAETAIHNGDPAPRKALWSREDPVTLFGAAVTGRGWPELEATFDWLGRSFSDCTSYENELVAAGASGDLAYHVAIEHSAASVNGAPRVYELRVTTVFRREDGQWRIVHRHGDPHTSDGTLERALGGELRP
ncbi:MAG: nuclear transport factor 2 family protein [Jatrophihabitans sp.]|uniref:YybH family protein n=1 Tax=Jatrophihabitans sp. TaxID=1932789 RepID=UPI003912F899